MKSVTLDQYRYGPICRLNLYNPIFVDILLKKVRHEKCDPRISMNSRINLFFRRLCLIWRPCCGTLSEQWPPSCKRSTRFTRPSTHPFSPLISQTGSAMPLHSYSVSLLTQTQGNTSKLGDVSILFLTFSPR